MRSTIDLRQSSFSLFCAASFVSTASTSTADCGAAAGALLAPLELEDVGSVEAGPVPGDIGGGLAPAWPKMVDTMFPSIDM
jgi:hypothetical protein